MGASHGRHLELTKALDVVEVPGGWHWGHGEGGSFNSTIWKVQRGVVVANVSVESPMTEDIGGGNVPGIDLVGVLRTSVVSCLRKWKGSIGLCDLLGKGVIDQ
jgi:hypothetical protein